MSCTTTAVAPNLTCRYTLVRSNTGLDFIIAALQCMQTGMGILLLAILPIKSLVSWELWHILGLTT